MAKIEKLIEKARNNPKGIRFTELVAIVVSIGYIHDRTSGSHMIYTHETLPMLNLQSAKGNAKAYQVRTVIALIDND